MKNVPGAARTLAVAAVGCVAALSLSACSGSSSGSSNSAQSFTYWSMWKAGEPQATVLKSAIDSFTKDTGIKVDVQWQGRDVLKKVTPTLRGGGTPDLVDQSTGTLSGGLVNVGQATDLAPVYQLPIPGEGQSVGQAIPGKFQQLAKSPTGLTFMVPYELLSEAVFYDKAKNPEIATSPPKTWNDFVALLGKLRAKGVAPLALDGDLLGADQFWAEYTLWRALGGGTNLQKAIEDKSGAAFGDPKILGAVQQVEALVKGGQFIKGYNASKWPAQEDNWAAGKAGLIFSGSWIPSETRPYAAPGAQVASFQFPALDQGGDMSVHANMIGFAVPKPATHKAAAEKFIAYVLTKSRLAGISTQAGNITPRTDIPAPAPLADLQQALLNGQVVQDPMGLANAAWNPQVLQPAASDFMNGKTDAAGFVRQLKEKTAAYWKQNG